jgi:hypothetical protein
LLPRLGLLPGFTPTLFVFQQPIELVFHPAAKVIELEATGAATGP